LLKETPAEARPARLDCPNTPVAEACMSFSLKLWLADKKLPHIRRVKNSQNVSLTVTGNVYELVCVCVIFVDPRIKVDGVY